MVLAERVAAGFLLTALLAATPAQAQCGDPVPTDLGALDTGLTGHVRAVFITPSDRPFRACVDEHLDTFIQLARQFFGDEMKKRGFVDTAGNGKTFDYEIGSDGRFEVVYMVGEHDSAWYQGKGGELGSAALDEMYQRLPSAYHRDNVVLYIYDLWEQQGTKLLYTGQAGSGAPWEGNGAGYTLQGAHFLGTDFDTLATSLDGQVAKFEQTGSSGLVDYNGDGNLTTLSRGQYASTAVGAALHELGHAFYLGHDFTDYDGDGIETNLMGNGFRRLSGRFTPAGYQPPTSLGVTAATSLDTALMFGGDACAPATVSPAAIESTVAGGSGTIEVKVSAACHWTASSSVSWTTIDSGANGSGDGLVGYTVSANSSSSTRTGSMTIAGRAVVVTQAAAAECTYSLDPGHAQFDSDGGTGEIDVGTTQGCAWTAIADAAWITVTEGETGAGSGKVRYRVDENAETAPREGTLSIAGETHTVAQAGIEVCEYSLSPLDINVDSGSQVGDVAVSTAAGCAWTATTETSWISITSGAGGTGSGNVEYAVAANGSSESRTGGMSIAELTLPVSQAGTPSQLEIVPIEVGIISDGGSGQIQILAAAGSDWRVSSDAAWIQIVSSTVGSGPGTATYQVQANPSLRSRVGTITVDTATVTVRQDDERDAWIGLASPSDIAGDSKEEMILFAREVDGAARGLWAQVYTGGGLRKASVFLKRGTRQVLVETLQLDRDDSAEMVTLEVSDTDDLWVRVRNGSGKVQGQRRVVGRTPVSDLSLFGLDVDGDGTDEVGVGYRRRDDGTGVLVVWDPGGAGQRSTGKLTTVPLGKVLSPFWGAGDFDGDGLDEVLVGYTRKTGRGARFRIVDPRTGSLGARHRLGGSRSTPVGWMIGNFSAANPGPEVLCVTELAAEAGAMVDVADRRGRRMSRAKIAPAGTTGHAVLPAVLGTSSSDPRRAVVAARSATGAWAFSAWDFSRKRSRRVGEELVLDVGYQIEAWDAGDFDGNAANGDELVIVHTDVRDRSIGYELWSLETGAKKGGATILPATAIAPRVSAGWVFKQGRYDLVVIARRLQAAPQLVVWQVDGAGRELLSRAVFNRDVR